MNMFKKNGGFTLVELIVVIAILAILAGIAVPAYSGYLKSAEKAGDITTLSAVKTAATAAMATEGGVENIRVEVDENGAISAVKVNVEKVEEVTDPTTGSVTTEAGENSVTLLGAGSETEDPEIVQAFAQYIGTESLELTYFETGAVWAGDEWTAYVVEETPEETT